MNYQDKYYKYKSKYLDLKNSIGGKLTELEESRFNQSIDEIKNNSLPSNKLFNQLINNDCDNIDVIAFKSNSIIDPNNNGYLGNLGLNINNNKIIGESCKDKPFDITNKSWCYFFVTFYEEFLLVNKKKHIDSELRLKELLGLKEEWGPYTHVVLLNIKKKDLFRPCYDKPNIESKECTKSKKEDNEYNRWLESFKNNSIKENIPFTGLGYTSDWINSDNSNYQGMTEMIIIPGSSVNIKHIFTFNEFIKKI
jgi:hypothetical protein